MMLVAKQLPLSWGLLTAAIVLCASGCATHWHVAPKPTEAVLEIRVGNQWQTMQRVRYVYPMPEPYQTLPTAELEALERQAIAEGDEARALAIRRILEARKLGIVPEEE